MVFIQMSDHVVPQQNQLLVLKVMRLARPHFNAVAGLATDPTDAMSVAIEEGACRRSGETEAGWPVGEFLMAPQNFENIYLGETFTFYVNCVNESEQRVADVSVKVELQTNSQRSSLPCRIQDVVLEAGAANGHVISHEVKETGQHILVCSVNYKTTSDEKMYFRKFFKFPVAKPIDVKTKFYNSEGDDVFLEAQVENVSAAGMVLEKIELEPSEHYSSQAIVPAPDPAAGPLSQLLKPRDIRQVLFRLSPKADAGKLDTNIGKLDMCWRTAMGERGRLQTSALQRMAPGHGDIRLTVEEIPAEVRARTPFQVVARVHNCSDRSLDLKLVLDGSVQPAMVWLSRSGVQLGALAPRATVDLPFELLPVALGFQSVSGIRLIDSFSKRTYEHDEIAHVFVM